MHDDEVDEVDRGGFGQDFGDVDRVVGGWVDAVAEPEDGEGDAFALGVPL